MTRTDPRRIAAALAVAAAIVAANPAAAAAQEPDATPRLTVGGQPLAKLLRTEPGAPFIAFESSKMRPARQVGDKGLGKRGRKIWRSALIGAGIGAGVGMLPGMSHCHNESGRNSFGCFGWALASPYGGYGALAGAGIGAAIGALRGK